MTDIFFSYSSADRERVRPIRDALAAQGFEVFWDQQVPAGMDWDTWIRQHLIKSKCAMAFWSATSVSSDNVRHEAMVAKQQGKLISVLLEPLTAEQFPMGLYAQQAANLSGWSGDYDNDQWRKFRREFEAKLTPLWVRRQIDEIEAELVGERTRREGAERRDRTMQAQIAKEVEVQQAWKRERDDAVDEVAKLKATVEELNQARADAKAKQAEAQQALTRDRNKAFDEVAALKTTVEELTQARADADVRVLDLSQRLRNVRKSKAQEIARSIGAALPPFVIAAAVATLGFWSYQLIWSAPAPLLAVTSESTPEAEQQRLAAIKEAEQLQGKAADAEAKLQAAETVQQRLQEEIQRQAKLAADAEAKLSAAEAEQARQAKAATDAGTKRKAAEAEQQRLKEEVQLQTKAAADAEAKRKAAEAGQQRLQEEVQRQAKLAPDAEAKRKAAEAEQQRLAALLKAEQERREKAEAEAAAAQLKSAALPQSPAPRSNQPAPTGTTGLFTIKTSTRLNFLAGAYDWSGPVDSRDECEQTCAQTASCKTFSYENLTKRAWDSKRSRWVWGLCYMDSSSNFSFTPNEKYDSGIRIEQTNPSADIKVASPTSPAVPTSSAGLFTIRGNTEAYGSYDPSLDYSTFVSRAECEESCARASICKVFAYDKTNRSCFRHAKADFRRNDNYDFGVRIEQPK